MAKQTYDLKLACIITIVCDEAEDGEDKLSAIIDEVSTFLNLRYLDVSKDIADISMEIDDAGGPVLIAQDGEDVW